MEESNQTQRQGEINGVDGDDGRVRRTGTVWIAIAHIITTATSFGVPKMAWDIAQLGWVGGPIIVILSPIFILYTSFLLADCCRTGTGNRNITYNDAIHSNLIGRKARIYGWFEYLNKFGIAIGCTVDASISIMAIRRSNCYHEKGRQSPSHISSNLYMIIFGIIQIIFSQIPDFDQIWWLSIVAPVMSFIYTSIGIGLSIVQVVANGGFKGSLTGISIGSVTWTQKIWRILQAFGNIAFSYSYSMDTIKAPPPLEAEVMEKATVRSLSVPTFFYMVFGCMGYAALGDSTPDNLLAGFGFCNPFWLLDMANAAIFFHRVVAYQVICQPLFAFIEELANQKWPDSNFISEEIRIRLSSTKFYKLNLFRLVWSSAFVVVTTVMSMFLPFFKDVFGLLGALGFWLLSVYFPVEMYIAQKKVPKWSLSWVCLQMLRFTYLVISVASAVGPIAGVVSELKVYKQFKSGS